MSNREGGGAITYLTPCIYKQLLIHFNLLGNTCMYACLTDGSCEVKRTGYFSGPSLGVCWSTGRCYGTPETCFECNLKCPEMGIGIFTEAYKSDLSEATRSSKLSIHRPVTHNTPKPVIHVQPKPITTNAPELLEYTSPKPVIHTPKPLTIADRCSHMIFSI